MGIEINSARFLLYSRNRGVAFDRTAMIGRQGLMLTNRQLRKSFQVFGDHLNDEEAKHVLTAEGGFAEPFFTRLGAQTVHSFDNSKYERATHIFDLNNEIPVEFKEQYTAVIDGGSLEHIFNFPTAIKNCMEMVKVGGHYLSITPSNNLLGHGFYQFSPELLFRVFTPDNGFELLDVIAFEDRKRSKWYAVKDPNAVRSRVTLINSRSVYLLVIAKRIAITSIFEKTPQQSDYVSIWDKSQAEANDEESRNDDLFVSRFKKKIPVSLKQLYHRYLRRSSIGFNSRFFVPFDPTAI